MTAQSLDTGTPDLIATLDEGVLTLTLNRPEARNALSFELIEQLEHAFIEFRPYLGKCRFNNCKHTHEPDCAIIGAVEDGKISPVRLAYYQGLTQEIGKPDY